MGERPERAEPTERPPRAVTSRTGQNLPREARVRRGGEIRHLLGRGKRTRTGHLDVFHAASPVSHPRWGIVVPKHRHELVERNLLKRRLREIGRREVLPRLREAGRAVDVLVRARREAYDATYVALRTELVAFTEELCSRGSSSG